MTNISTNNIRAFNDKVRALASSNSKNLTLTLQEARNLNHEINQLMSRLLELQEIAEVGKIDIQVSGQKF